MEILADELRNAYMIAMVGVESLSNTPDAPAEEKNDEEEVEKCGLYGTHILRTAQNAD